MSFLQSIFMQWFSTSVHFKPMPFFILQAWWTADKKSFYRHLAKKNMLTRGCSRQWVSYNVSVTRTIKLVMQMLRLEQHRQFYGILTYLQIWSVRASDFIDTFHLIMPTSTVPFEVSLEFLNDTSGPAMLQLSQGDGEVSGGATTLYPQETISLILDAGSTYHYILIQHTLKAHISCVSDRLGWYYTVDDSFSEWQYGRMCTSPPQTSLLRKEYSTIVNLRSCKASRLSSLIMRWSNQCLREPLHW